MSELSHEPLSVPSGQRAESLVLRINCVQNPCTVCENALTRGSETLLKNAGVEVKYARETASSSRPSPRKLLSTKLRMSPSVLVGLLIASNEARTSLDVFDVGLSTNVLGSM